MWASGTVMEDRGTALKPGKDDCSDANSTMPMQNGSDRPGTASVDRKMVEAPCGVRVQGRWCGGGWRREGTTAIVQSSMVH